MTPKRSRVTKTAALPLKEPSRPPKTGKRYLGGSVTLSIDLGSTYSGVAYEFSEQPNVINCVTRWPNSNKSVEKVPSILIYDSDKSVKYWGLEAAARGSQEQKVIGFKLLLDPKQNIPFTDQSSVKKTKQLLESLNITPVQAAANYLENLKESAITYIDDLKSASNYVSSIKKQWVLTIPALWSDLAKSNTREAARRAGIWPVKLVKEPESAGLYNIYHYQRQGSTVGDAITILDIGGGTTDMVSYEIVNIDPLKLIEVVRSSGSPHGGLLVDDCFKKWLHKTLGREYEKLSDTVPFHRCMESFERMIKRDFEGPQDLDVNVNFPRANLPDDKGLGIHNDSLKLSANDLVVIFEPIVTAIVKLVREQLDSAAKVEVAIHSILIVGGCSDSPYIRSVLKANFPDVRIVTQSSWTAIARGGVLFSHPEQAEVMESIAERSYGVRCREDHDPKKHRGLKTYFNHHEGKLQVDAIRWYIKKENKLKRDVDLWHDFVEHYPAIGFKKHGSSDIDIELVSSEADEPPDHPDKSVILNTTLSARFEDFPEEAIELVSPGGAKPDYIKVAYELGFCPDGAGVSFKIAYEGQEIARVSAVVH